MAIGTSDGEYYPSKLEEVLAALDTSGSMKEPAQPRNAAQDNFREINEQDEYGPGVTPKSPVLPGINDKGKSDQNPNQKILRVENESPSLDNVLKQLDQQTQPPASASPTQEDFDRLMQQPRAKDSHAPKPEDSTIPPNAQPTQGIMRLTNKDAADLEMNLTPQEKDLYDRHILNLHGPGGVDNPDGTRSSLYASTVEHNGRFYVTPMVHEGKILSPQEADALAEKEGWDKFPSYATEEEAQKRYEQMHSFMEKDTQAFQESNAPTQQDFDRLLSQPRAKNSHTKGSFVPGGSTDNSSSEGGSTYDKIVNFLDSLSDMKGAEKWSPRELAGYAFSMGMNTMRAAPTRTPTASGYANTVTEPLRPANDNEARPISMANKMDAIERMSPKEFKDYILSREEDFQKNGGPPPAPGSSAEEFINSVKNGRTPYEQAVKEQQDRAFEERLKKLTAPSLEVIEGGKMDNPSQEPQAANKATREQIALQKKQQAEQAAKQEKVNVGRGKGVLNDNLADVQDMISKDSTPSEIARKYDITPAAVRAWMKTKGAFGEEKVVGIKDNPAEVNIDGTWYRGASHADATEAAAAKLGISYDEAVDRVIAEGFYTNKFRHVSREEAFRLADKNKQISTEDSTSHQFGELYSEDLKGSPYEKHQLTEAEKKTIQRYNEEILNIKNPKPKK